MCESTQRSSEMTSGMRWLYKIQSKNKNKLDFMKS